MLVEALQGTESIWGRLFTGEFWTTELWTAAFWNQEVAAGCSISRSNRMRGLWRSTS